MLNHEVTTYERLVPGTLMLKQGKLRRCMLRARCCIHAIRLLDLGVYLQQQLIHITVRPLDMQRTSIHRRYAVCESSSHRSSSSWLFAIGKGPE